MLHPRYPTAGESESVSKREKKSISGRIEFRWVFTFYGTFTHMNDLEQVELIFVLFVSSLGLGSVFDGQIIGS